MHASHNPAGHAGSRETDSGVGLQATVNRWSLVRVLPGTPSNEVLAIYEFIAQGARLGSREKLRRGTFDRLLYDTAGIAGSFLCVVLATAISYGNRLDQ